MVKSIRCKETEKVFSRHLSRRFPPSMQNKAYRKLILLDAAEKLDDLRVPPGNRLGKLSGDREGHIVYELMTSFGFALSGMKEMPTK